MQGRWIEEINFWHGIKLEDISARKSRELVLDALLHYVKWLMLMISVKYFFIDQDHRINMRIGFYSFSTEQNYDKVTIAGVGTYSGRSTPGSLSLPGYQLDVRYVRMSNDI